MRQEPSDRRITAFNDWLAISSQQELVWGMTDCTSWPARAVEFWLGIDIPRPRFSSALQAERLMRQAGGLVPLWDAALAEMPLAVGYDLNDVAPFDVGIVKVSDGSERGCLFAARHMAYWVALSGIVPFRPNHIIKFWHTPEVGRP